MQEEREKIKNLSSQLSDIIVTHIKENNLDAMSITRIIRSLTHVITAIFGATLLQFNIPLNTAKEIQKILVKALEKELNSIIVKTAQLREGGENNGL